MLLSSARWAAEWFWAGASAGGRQEDGVKEAFILGVMGMRSRTVLRPEIRDDE